MRRLMLVVVGMMMAGNALAADTPVNAAARYAAQDSEVCVTNAAGGTTITGFTARKAVEIQNQGPNAIYCRADGGEPFADSRARKIAADSQVSLDIGNSMTIRCIAATAAQAAHACTHLWQLR